MFIKHILVVPFSVSLLISREIMTNTEKELNIQEYRKLISSPRAWSRTSLLKFISNRSIDMLFQRRSIKKIAGHLKDHSTSQVSSLVFPVIDESVITMKQHKSIPLILPRNQYLVVKLMRMVVQHLSLGWFLSQHKQYGLITFHCKLQRVVMHVSLHGVIASHSCGISTDWAYCQIVPNHFYDEEPMVHFLNAVAGDKSIRLDVGPNKQNQMQTLTNTKCN